MFGKTASTAWREYYKKGGRLSFVEFLNQEKEKFQSADGEDSIVLVNKTLNDSVHNAINDALRTGGLKDAADNTIFGINKTAFILSVLILTAGGIYLITQINRK